MKGADDLDWILNPPEWLLLMHTVYSGFDPDEEVRKMREIIAKALAESETKGGDE